MHINEKQFVRKDELPFITFHTYENVYLCSQHGPLPDNQRACLYFAGKKDGEKDGKINVSNKIVSKSIPFSVFETILFETVGTVQKTQVPFHCSFQKQYCQGGQRGDSLTAGSLDGQGFCRKSISPISRPEPA